jgi:quercetin dioxygenase-like cupin family protein
MLAFELDDLEAARAGSARRYLEFVSVPALSLGLYVLPAGGVDTQEPHGEDEAYFVLRGTARISVADEVREVRPGSVVFVDATIPHRFHDIEEELVLLVAFGPAEGSVAAAAGQA